MQGAELFPAAAFFCTAWPNFNILCCPARKRATLHNLCFTLFPSSSRSAAFPSGQNKHHIKRCIRSISMSGSLSTGGNVQKLSQTWQTGWQHQSLIDWVGLILKLKRQQWDQYHFILTDWWVKLQIARCWWPVSFKEEDIHLLNLAYMVMTVLFLHHH